MGYHSTDGFQIVLVDAVEGRQLLAVDVEHSPHLAVGGEEGDDNLRPRQTAARDMSGERFDVGNDDCLALLPCGAADAAAIGDVHAGQRALERTQQQFAVLHAVETRPEEPHRFMDEGADVGHHRYLVGLARNERTDLLRQQLVFLFFAIHYMLLLVGLRLWGAPSVPPPSSVRGAPDRGIGRC